MEPKAGKREAELERQRDDEIRRHHHRIEDLQRGYQNDLEYEREAHADRMDQIQRAMNGEFVPGICPACGQSYSSFHQWDDYEQCPRCGADLPKE